MSMLGKLIPGRKSTSKEATGKAKSPSPSQKERSGSNSPPASLSTPAPSSPASTSGACADHDIDPNKLTPPDQKVVHQGLVWKLSPDVDPKDPSSWLQRKMWLTSHGGLFYYSHKHGKPLGRHIKGLNIRQVQYSSQRFAFEVHPANVGQSFMKPTILACETEQEREQWVKHLSGLGDSMLAGVSQDLNPLDVFHGQRRRSARKGSIVEMAENAAAVATEVSAGKAGRLSVMTLDPDSGFSPYEREDIMSDASGLRSGTFEHEDGWEVSYNSKKVVIPPGVRITVHVHDPVSIMELERMGQDDIRTLATEYKQALIENLDQFYVMVNSAYMKRMNRTNDIASTDGWEIFVRAKEYLIACILLRREYIPPLCDTSQDIAILLRCPAVPGITYETCEVLIDECRFIADSVAPVPSGNEVYREIIQAKLDALQFNEEAYRWLEGHLKLTPTHKRPAALKFVKSIVKILDGDGLLWDKDLIDQFGDEIPTLHAPLLVAQEMLSDASGLIAGSCDSQMEAGERRNAWFARISRYLAYCLDGGLIGDRFTLSTVVQSVGKGSYETDKMLKLVVEFLLHLRERGDWNRSFAGARLPLAQLLQDPEEFAKYTFNERVMRVLLMENYIQNEWRKRSNSSGSSYEKLLASLLTSEYVGIGLRTLICRQILEQTNVTSAGPEEKHIQVLVPALVNVMQGSNLSLTSCATAALVNLSCGKQSTKTLLMSEGCMKICIRQLKVKDDDLTLYTLYLLVNLTKTPHHRAIVIKEGGLPMLVDILTSSYQNLRKHKILTEVASVVGQLCNDAETRNFLSEDYPVVPCLLWIYDGAQPNTKLKSKLLFALRQLCVLGVNKIRVGTHVIPQVIEELAMANPKFEECATNGVLLLTMLANIHTNALMMNHEGRLNDALEQCGIQENDMEKKNHKFSPALWDKIVALKERVAEAEAKAA
eukprot:gnl/TRDRNA2_/TRDRNA2_167378_c0_seq2.p1 gnl/TRDRNA2_/TRDRNA2_167378_c0~~gnl/TRDRNA2_/TRDRNA2_167378_c0_seq2.p1  ORF type:complete len:939 (+),score=174.64 gnl/TRDRNA2_/TRDRNA2_167378_c0_seq2:112-2928(+)